jgi:ribokinase
MAKPSSIVVIGSSNTDMVIRTQRIPSPGETILGGDFFMNPGGKGANQAVAAARLGGQVCFICKTGDDLFGRKAIEQFLKEGIDTRFVQVDDRNPSGVAMISVDPAGENAIVVAPGANAALDAASLLPAAGCIAAAGMLLLQLEIPLQTVEYAISLAGRKGVYTCLNPAPAFPLPDKLLAAFDMITPNQKEASLLSGIGVENHQDARRAARNLRERGAKSVLITLGAEGVLVLDGEIFTFLEAYPVLAVDSTAAGDIFNGALVVGLAEGMSVEEAAGFACAASAISVTRPGAQSSAPYRREVDKFRKEHPGAGHR